MSILAQIGTTLGAEFKSLGSRVSALESGGGGGGVDLVDDYSETTFVNGLISQITTWSTPFKTILMQTKSFTYTGDYLTQIVVTNGDDVTEFTQTFTYDSEGNLESTTKDYA